jgi:hypothetical protein
MTIESDITTALAAYSVRETVLSKYTKARGHSIKHYIYDIHVEHAALSDIPTIVAALSAMTGYNTVIAQMTSSWPLAGFYYSRFEVDILL